MRVAVVEAGRAAPSSSSGCVGGPWRPLAAACCGSFCFLRCLSRPPVPRRRPCRAPRPSSPSLTLVSVCSSTSSPFPTNASHSVSRPEGAERFLRMVGPSGAAVPSTGAELSTGIDMAAWDRPMPTAPLCCSCGGAAVGPDDAPRAAATEDLVLLIDGRWRWSEGSVTPSPTTDTGSSPTEFPAPPLPLRGS